MMTTTPTARWRLLSNLQEEVELTCDKCGVSFRARGRNLHGLRGLVAEWHYRKHFKIPAW